MPETQNPISGTIDLCYDNDPELLPVAEAQRRIAAHTPRVHEEENLPLRSSLNRILAGDVFAPHNVPGYTNSAVDGYALAGCDLPSSEAQEFRVIGKTFAGKPYTGSVGAGECIHIMTGGMMPEGCDSVVMQEHVQHTGTQSEPRVQIANGHSLGQNVRAAGEDLSVGSLALARGARLLPAQIGLLASLGMSQIRVVRKLKVAFFSTGDELRSLDEPLNPGEVYDSNRYTLHAMLERMDVDIHDLGVIPDDPDAIHQALSQCAELADVVLTSGGVSAGEADFVQRALSQLGQVGFWKIAIRPGRPLTFGRIGDSVFFGLPGNPVAVMVTFYQFVQEALLHMMGDLNTRALPLMQATCSMPLRKKPGRVEYYRAVLSRDSDGQLQVSPTGKTGSGLLHTMSDANCFIVLDENSASLESGASVKVQPFFGLV
jgi:molybdopterin molybdotransferase